MSPDPKKATFPEQYPDFDRQHDDDDLPCEPAFDWKSFQALCVAPEPNHPIYGMSVGEYAKYIQKHGEDDEKLVALTFRVLPDIAMGLPILARMHRMSLRRYLTIMVVLGLVTFQKDYHDIYSVINIRIEKAFKGLSDKSEFALMSQIRKQTIALGTSAHANEKFQPSLPEWVAASITTVAKELNTTNSDMINICLAIALVNDSKDTETPKIYIDLAKEFLAGFENQLGYLSNRVDDIYTQLGGD